MKYIALSFDDARADAYDVAKPIMEKYGLTATVNVISDFVLNSEHYNFVSAKKAMSPEQVLNWQRWGGEIACHGSTHKNTPNDILNNIEELKLMGVNTDNIGFASPESWLTFQNVETSGIKDVWKKGIVGYLRSGIQVKRQGVWYTFLYVIEMLTHSEYLYYLLNRSCIFKYKNAPDLVLSTAIKNYTTVDQIKSFIAKMKDDDALIIMMHSVLSEGDEGYGADHYYWDSKRFEEMCKYLSEDVSITVLNTCDLFA